MNIKARLAKLEAAQPPARVLDVEAARGRIMGKLDAVIRGDVLPDQVLTFDPLRADIARRLEALANELNQQD